MKSAVLSAPTTPARIARRILLRCPDITLKGANQADFQRRLLNNTARRLRAEGLELRVSGAHGRAYVDYGSGEGMSDALAVLREVPGIDSICDTRWVRPRDLGAEGSGWPLVERAAVQLAQTCYRAGASFAVHVNRVDKRLPLDSQQMAERLGDAIRAGTGWERVDLKQPDQRLFVDVYPDGVYLYTEKLQGPGGLPTGSSGRVLALLSGGIDSPVAAYQLAKRGAELDLFHVTAGHTRADALAASVVGRLAARLSRYSLQSRLLAVPNTYLDLLLGGRRTGYEALLLRRFMLRAARRIAERVGAAALVTGDSLGQVASQTMDNLVSTGDAVDALVLRPLIGSNKQEIIALARAIGTYEISIEPYKDCCALLAEHPRTRSTPGRLRRLEAELGDRSELLERTLDDLIELRFDCGRYVGQSG